MTAPPRRRTTWRSDPARHPEGRRLRFRSRSLSASRRDILNQAFAGKLFTRSYVGARAPRPPFFKKSGARSGNAFVAPLTLTAHARNRDLRPGGVLPNIVPGRGG